MRGKGYTADAVLYGETGARNRETVAPAIIGLIENDLVSRAGEQQTLLGLLQLDQEYGSGSSSEQITEQVNKNRLSENSHFLQVTELMTENLLDTLIKKGLIDQ